MEASVSDFKERCIKTIGLIFIWRILSLIPIPRINYNYYFFNFNINNYKIKFFPINRHFKNSIFEFGILPYLITYVFVELLSLFQPPLKSWRTEGQTGRAKLKKTAYVLTFFYCLRKYYSYSLHCENIMDLVSRPGFIFRLEFTAFFILGTFLLIFIAHLITEKGIGHGISVILAAEYIPYLIKYTVKIKPHSIFITFIATVLVAVIVYFEKSHRNIPVKFDHNLTTNLPLKLTTAGIVPAIIISNRIHKLDLLFFIYNRKDISNWFINNFPFGKIGHCTAYFIAILIIYFILTAFFHIPNKILDFLKKRNASLAIPDEDEGKIYIDRRLEIMAFLGSIYLSFIYIFPIFTKQFFGLQFSVLDLIAVVAITLDIIDEARLRMELGYCKKIAEFHDIWLAGLFKNLLECHGIPCCLKGYYHRSLFYFFGPFLEVSVLVPEKKVKEAEKLIEKYEFIPFRINTSIDKKQTLKEGKKMDRGTIIKISERSFRYPDIYCRCGKRMKAVFEDDGPIHQENVHFICNDYIADSRKHDLLILDKITEEEAKIINQEIMEGDKS